MIKNITITTASVNDNKEQVWNRNTHLGVNLKTMLRSHCTMKPGREYVGVLRRDVDCDEFRYDEHFTFIETEPQKGGKRNPRIFEGKYITVTRWADGSYHPNFRPMPIGDGFSVERYIAGVANELLCALLGLVGKE